MLTTTLLHTRFAARHTLRNVTNVTARPLHTTRIVRQIPTALNNILAGGPAPLTQVKTVSPEGIHLQDGRIIPSSCIFLDGKVFLWDVPQTLWDGWTNERFQVFDVVVPKPGACCSLYFGCCSVSAVLFLSVFIAEILLLGTGKRLIPPPPSIRQYLNSIGIQIDIMDTVRRALPRS